MNSRPDVCIVIPTIGRPSLELLLAALVAQAVPCMIVLVDDRPAGHAPLQPGVAASQVRVVRSYGGGPAAARNLGWRNCDAEWIAFLDDDVVPDAHWWSSLVVDLDRARPEVGGSAGRLRVPLPADRRPTDWERSTAGLEHAEWITADLAYRRQALDQIGGFDERFRRAYREDADLALRVRKAGWQLTVGTRSVFHPVRPEAFGHSLRAQRGNGDDMLMRRLHGRSWRADAGAPAGLRNVHLATTAVAVAAAVAVVFGFRRTALVLAASWAASAGWLTVRRIAPGPLEPSEVLRMLATTPLLAPLATWHSALGWVRHRRADPWIGLPSLVLFDRDGTLIVDQPYAWDPSAIIVMPEAEASLTALRRQGVRTGVVTNQSGVARGLLSTEQVAAMNDEVERLLGPFDVWRTCMHAAADECDCRKPKPGMVLSACEELGVRPDRCVVIGDIESDMQAAALAGAFGILVPAAATLHAEIARARNCAPSLLAATIAILRGKWRASHVRGPSGLGSLASLTRANRQFRREEHSADRAVR